MMIDTLVPPGFLHGRARTRAASGGRARHFPIPRLLPGLRPAALALAALLPALSAAPAAIAAEVNLYSYRQPFLIEPILAKFTEETGVEVNVVFAKKGMIDKIRAAGDNNPADAVLTVDVGRLDGLEKAGLLEPVQSSVLEANVPAHLRHPDGLWFGLTTRARVVYAHRDRVAADEIRNTADLAHPRFRGRVCSRLRQARLQRRLPRRVHRPPRGGGRRRMAPGRQGQSRPQAAGQRPCAGEGDLRGGVRRRARQHLLHGQDGHQRGEARAAGLGEGGARAVPSTRRAAPAST